MIRADVLDALEAAGSCGQAERSAGRRPRRHGVQTVRAIVLAVVQELPQEMTLGELADELQIAENQYGEE